MTRKRRRENEIETGIGIEKLNRELITEIYSKLLQNATEPDLQISNN